MSEEDARISRGADPLFAFLYSPVTVMLAVDDRELEILIGRMYFATFRLEMFLAIVALLLLYTFEWFTDESVLQITASCLGVSLGGAASLLRWE